MSVRERILTIRLLTYIARHPEFAAALGIEAIIAPPDLEPFERKRGNNA